MKAFAVVCIAALAALAPVTSRADQVSYPGNGNDWAMVTVQAGPEGAGGVRFDLTESVVSNDDMSLVLGWGAAGASGADYADNDISTFSSPTTNGVEVRAAVTTPAGAIDVHRRVANGYFEYGVGDGAPLTFDPGTTVTYLVFAAGGTVKTFAVDLSSAEGSVAVASVEMGTGSQRIYVTEPGQGNAAVSAWTASAGISTTTRTLASGIAGGFVLPFADSIQRDVWSAPDGRSGEFDTEILGVGYGFGSWPGWAGPAGSWTWTWEGVETTSNGIVGAYAPVGDAWRMFVSASG